MYSGQEVQFHFNKYLQQVYTETDMNASLLFTFILQNHTFKTHPTPTNVHVCSSHKAIQV